MKNMKKILLIVDDEAIVHKILSSQLDQKEIEILIAKDGEEGLKTALERHPNLILLDLIMPRMDGMTMLEKLRQDEWGKKATVVILTNLSDAETATEAAKHGIYDYLVKADWDIIDLINKVKDKLGL